MTFKFSVTILPNANQEQLLAAYLEGKLSINHASKVCFEEDGILLIELAVTIKNWLSTTKDFNAIDFLFNSMDYDETILSFYHIGHNEYLMNSIWKTCEFDHPIHISEMKECFKQFLKEIDSFLQLNYSTNLDTILSKNE